jgi:hypothetical protein
MFASISAMGIFDHVKEYFRRALMLPLGASLLFAFPASTNFQLKDFGYGGGGLANGTSSNYAIEGIAGEQNATTLDGTTYDLGPGLQFTNQANVPPAPTFTNPANYYNKLKLVLNTGNNPSDTVFAIAISSDNFATDTRYVQSDNTVGATLGLEDYRTYTSFGGASGFNIMCEVFFTDIWIYHYPYDGHNCLPYDHFVPHAFTKKYDKIKELQN